MTPHFKISDLKVTIGSFGSNNLFLSLQVKFLNYDQSNQCRTMRDSSVSYAAASFTIG